LTALAGGLLAPTADAVAPGAAPLPELRLMRGDDPRWAGPGWDDREWTRIAPAAIPLRTGPFWLRFRATLPAPAAPRPATEPGRGFRWPVMETGAPLDGVALAPLFAFELYWDGRLLRRCGGVGADRATEVPGPLEHLVRIPDDLRGPGEHVVALRVSSHRFNLPAACAGLQFRLVNHAQELAEEARRPILPLVGISCALLLAAVCLVLLPFAERRRPLVLSIALCGALAAYYALVAPHWACNPPFDWHRLNLEAVSAMMAVISGLVPWLLAELFDLPHRRWWLAGLGLALVAESLLVSHHEARALWLSRTMLLAALGVAGWAAGRGRWIAWVVVAGTVLRLGFVAPTESAFRDDTFFVIVCGLVLVIGGSISAQWRAGQRRVREAELTAARLEIELLKKNIQPHFLMNTLATIVEVVEQEPKTAVTLIEALAGEFRILARVSGEKLIPLGQELELCRAHLRIMSVRRGLRCALTATGIDEAALVPPALFHTLVEGGLTHQRPKAGEINFTLEGATPPGGTRYTLTVHGETPPGGIPPAEDGTGLRYVKARLEESFAGRWSLTAGPVPAGWRTVIEIRSPATQEEAV
jgi:hypothetical protein